MHEKKNHLLAISKYCKGSISQWMELTQLSRTPAFEGFRDGGVNHEVRPQVCPRMNFHALLKRYLECSESYIYVSHIICLLKSTTLFF